MLHRNSILFYFFLLVYSSIFTNARPLTIIRELSWRETQVLDGLEILGEPYNFEPLSAADQGFYSASYSVVDGFVVDGKRVPAILKVVVDSKDEDSKTRKEIGFLRKPAVNLLLHWEWVETRASYYIIVKNVREADPPFKPLFEHYLEDTDMVALDALQTARDTVFKRLLEFGKTDNLLYFDYHQRNIFFGKALQTAMPIDWGPKAYYAGVEEIVEMEEKESKIQQLKDSMEKHLPEDYSLDKLEDELFRHGKDLRPKDRDRREHFDGVFYDLVRIDIDRKTKTFRISDGFKGKPALMKIIKGLDEGRTTRLELKQKGLYLDSEIDFKSKRYYIVMEDKIQDQLD